MTKVSSTRSAYRFRDCHDALQEDEEKASDYWKHMTTIQPGYKELIIGGNPLNETATGMTRKRTNVEVEVYSAVQKIKFYENIHIRKNKVGQRALN